MISGSDKISIPGAGTRSQVLTVSHLRDAVGYSKQVPVIQTPAATSSPSWFSGSPPPKGAPITVIVIPDGVSILQLSPVNPIAELIVKLPANPVDGHLVYIYSTQAIGALTILANTGQKLNWSPAVPPAPAPAPGTPAPKPPSLALAADTRVGYLYSAPNATWDRIQ